MKVKFLILSAIFMLAIPKVPYGQRVCVSIVENRETDFRDANGECYNYVKYIPNENSAVLNVKINLHLLEENNVRSISKNTQRNWVYWVPAPAEPVIFPLQQRTVMDTILLDRPCVVTDFILRDESWHQYDVILSEDSERTFFYDPVLGSFKLLYDFTLRQGDQYAVYPTIGSMSDSLVVTIDSVGSEWIDGVMLRVQYAHDQYYAQQNGQSFTYRWTFGNHTASPFKIMERVGSDYYFVPQEVAFGDIITKGLCSYVDDAILYQTNDTMDCSQPYTYDIESHSTMECKVWPNPVANTLSVSSEECLANVRMYDIYGKLL